jgi:hypothetical protein
MQKAAGTGNANLDWSARDFSAALKMDRCLHSFPDAAFILPIRKAVRSTANSGGRRACVPVSARCPRRSRLAEYAECVGVRMSSGVSKRSDRRINVGNSSLSIASGRWIIRASPDGLQ